jgi:hypothetical protein
MTGDIVFLVIMVALISGFLGVLSGRWMLSGQLEMDANYDKGKYPVRLCKGSYYIVPEHTYLNLWTVLGNMIKDNNSDWKKNSLDIQSAKPL